MLKQLFRTKQVVQDSPEPVLKRCLTGSDLILMGIGAIIGAGIFVLTGIAAATHAGPAVVLSYLLAGLACSFAALCYAELAASIGGAGSAYSYAYVGLGEIIAWIIGWDLLLEYGVSVCAVAIGWSGYVNDALVSIGLALPTDLIKGYGEGGIVNLPAMLIILILSCVVALGVKQSAKFNSAMVCIKLAVIALFIVIAAQHVNIDYWKPFMPFGFSGVSSGAALVFFAFIGFDAVSTTAEEAVNPQRDLTRGIIGSLLICTFVYVVVSGLLTGIMPYQNLNVKSPVAESIFNLGYKVASGVIAVGAIAGLTSVMLIFMYGLSRICYSISRDGLLPKWFGEVHPKTHTPVKIILISGFLLSLVAGLFSMAEVAELVNIGTLAAFVIVCIGVAVLRHRHPNMPRPFQVPFSPYLPFLGVLSCGYLMYSLPLITWLRFLIWMGLGLLIYFVYGYRRSKLAINMPSDQ